jgi:hypothetical protein
LLAYTLACQCVNGPDYEQLMAFRRANPPSASLICAYTLVSGHIAAKIAV